MTYQYNDAGRQQAGFKSDRDCGIRAVAIACGMSYIESRKFLKEFTKKGKAGDGAIARGIFKEDMNAALESLGWVWMSAPKFEGRKARYNDLPPGTHIAQMAKHFVAIIDGTLIDTWDSRQKMVYGYWTKP